MHQYYTTMVAIYLQMLASKEFDQILPNVPGATFISRATSIVVAEALNDLKVHFTYSGTSSVCFQGKTFCVSGLQPILT